MVGTAIAMLNASQKYRLPKRSATKWFALATNDSHVPLKTSNLSGSTPTSILTAGDVNGVASAKSNSLTNMLVELWCGVSRLVHDNV